MNDIVFKKKLSKDIYIYLLGLRKRNLRNFIFYKYTKKISMLGPPLQGGEKLQFKF